jgi:hypothetical protein
MDSHFKHGPYETDYKKVMRAYLVILGAISYAPPGILKDFSKIPVIRIENLAQW